LEFAQGVFYLGLYFPALGSRDAITSPGTTIFRVTFTMHCTSLRASLFLTLALPGWAKVPSNVTDGDLSILAGAHVIYSWPNTIQIPDDLVQLVRDGVVGGVILFGENVGNGTAAALASLQSDYASSPAAAVFKRYLGMNGPLFINTDQEGGLVRRIKTGGPLQTAKQVGASPDPAAAGTAAGEQAAAALHGDNFNGNLAPVLEYSARREISWITSSGPSATLLPSSLLPPRPSSRRSRPLVFQQRRSTSLASVRPLTNRIRTRRP
jgi:hypothetical protein